MSGNRKILITFDCNDQSADKLLDYAKEYILKDSDTVYLMTVTREEPILEKDKMDWAIKKIPAAAPLMIKGDARDKILEISNEIGIDVIVMGSRHLRPVHKALIGSVSSYVVNHSTCSVFIVK